MPPLEPKERKHFSVSEVREFLSCPLRWWYKYRLGLWTDSTTSFFAMGNSIHAGLQHFYGAEALDGYRDPEKARSIYRRTWADESAGVDWKLDPDKDPLLIAQTGMGLLNLSMGTPDDWTAVATERTLYGDVVHSRLGKLPYPLKSKSDMLVEGERGAATPDVVEHKSADKGWPAGKERSEAQPTGYTIVVRANYDHDPTTTYNIMVANVKPVLDRARVVRRDQDDIDRLYLQLRTLLDMEERGGVFPNPTAFAHKSCEFRRVCDDWTGHPQTLPSGEELQARIAGLGDYAARVPGARWKQKGAA